MTDFQDLLIRIDATAEPLRQEVRKVDNTLTSFERSVNRTTDNIRRQFLAIGGAVAAAFSLRAIANITEANARLVDLSKQVGISGKTLSEFRYIATQSGASLEALATGLKQMQKNVSDASRGVGEAKNILKDLGLSAAELKKQSPEETFQDITQALSELADPADRVNAAMKLFGRSGAELIPILSSTAAEIENMRQNAVALGASLSDEVLSGFEKLDDALNDVSVASQGLLTSLTGVFGTTTTNLIEHFASVIATAGLGIKSLGKEVLALEKFAINARIAFNELTGDFEESDDLLEKRRQVTKKEIELQKELDAQGQALFKRINHINDGQAKNTEIVTKNNKVLQDHSTILKEKVAPAQKFQTDHLYQYLAVLELENELIRLSNRERKIREAILRAESAAQQDGNVLTKEHEAHIRQLVGSMHDWEEAQYRVAESADVMDDRMRHALDGIQDELDDFINKLLHGDASLKSFGQGVFDVITRDISSRLAAGIMGGAGGGGGSSSLGGGILDFAGSLFGKSSLGASFNTAVTSSLPSVFATGAPIGAAVGPTQAGILGGLGLTPAAIALPIAALAVPALIKAFSGTPHPAASFRTTVGAGGAFGALDLRSKHQGTEQAEALAQTIGAVTAALGQSGAAVEGRKLRGELDKLGQSFLELDEKVRFAFDPKDDASLSNAIEQLAEEMTKAGDVSEDMRAAIAKLRSESNTSVQTLEELAKAAALPGLRKEFTQSVQDSLLQALDPDAFQRLSANRQLQENLKRAVELNAGSDVIRQIQQLHELNLRTLDATSAQAQAMEQISGKFKSIFNDLRFGGLSALNPKDRLEAVRTQVRALGLRAGAGDTTAANDLADLLPEFVKLSGEVNGFNSAFEADRKIAEGYAQQHLDIAAKELDLQSGMFDEAKTHTQLLTDIKKGLGLGDRDFGKNQALNRTLAALFPDFKDNFGGGNFDRFILGRSAQDQSLANAVIKANLPGFADGGLVSPMGGFVHPHEFVMRADAVRAIGAGNLASMNATGQMATGDTGLVERVDRLSTQMERLIKLTAAIGDASMDRWDGMNDKLTEMRDVRALKNSLMR